MVLTQIIWTCFGWIFRWGDPPKKKGQQPLARNNERTPSTPVASDPTALTALFWEAYGAAIKSLKTGSQGPVAYAITTPKAHCNQCIFEVGRASGDAATLNAERPAQGNMGYKLQAPSQEGATLSPLGMISPLAYFAPCGQTERL